MPELPEVETVRRGLTAQVLGRTMTRVGVYHERVARRHAAGSEHLVSVLEGRAFRAVDRRGKYLWFVLDDAGQPAGALIAHLGMSGQFRISGECLEQHPHRRFDALLDDGRWLTFLDQRTFGGLAADELTDDTGPAAFGGRRVPRSLTHIAPDPFEPGFDVVATARRMRQRRTEVKRALLDQSLVSGIGNIYADEALWRARLHPARRTEKLSNSAAVGLLEEATDVMAEALVAGGTSFDQLYVNVNGESGYFSRSLAAYGREGGPCPRCGRPIRRIAFTNRSSFLCPRCQRAPRPAPGAQRG